MRHVAIKTGSVKTDFFFKFSPSKFFIFDNALKFCVHELELRIFNIFVSSIFTKNQDLNHSVEHIRCDNVILIKWRLLKTPEPTFHVGSRWFNSFVTKWQHIWWYRSGSTLAQVMVCWLTAPSHVHSSLKGCSTVQSLTRMGKSHFWDYCCSSQ